MNNERSVAAAERCAKSIPDCGPQFFPAITPKDDPLAILEERGIPSKGFVEEDQKYTELEPCVSAFLSHHSLWMKSIELNTEIQILEHDAVAVGPVPGFIPYDKVMSLGRPSYGKFNTPTSLGVGPLVSKPYFPGAHAYRVKPAVPKYYVKQLKSMLVALM